MLLLYKVVGVFPLAFAASGFTFMEHYLREERPGDFPQNCSRHVLVPSGFVELVGYVGWFAQNRGDASGDIGACCG